MTRRKKTIKHPRYAGPLYRHTVDRHKRNEVIDVTWKKGLLLAQSALCVVLVVMLSAGAIGIYRQGVAEKQENSLAWIYTREKVGTALKPVAPVFLLSVAATVACAVLHVRDENEGKPVRDIELTRNLMRRRVAEPDDDMKRARSVLLALAAVFIIAGIFNGSMTAVVNKAIRICTECIGLG